MSDNQNKNIFDHLDNVTKGKKIFDTNDPRDTADYNQYMMNRYLSMSTQTIKIAETLNQLRNVSDKVHHDFLVHCLPKDKKYFKYIRGKKEGNIADLKMIMTYYKVGLTQAREYYSILNPEQLKHIRSRFKTGRK